MSGKIAFVTGATGLLGSNLCRALVSQGWQVKGLVRSLDKAKRFLGDSNIELIQGDIEDVPAFTQALKGVDVVFHTAAFFREYYQPGSDWQKMKRINVDTTIELLQAAEAQGVAKVVFTSSSGVIQTDPHQAATETAPYNKFAEQNLYFKTKILAEQEIYRFLNTSQIDVVMILPGWMMGPGDAAPTSAGQLVLDLLAGKLPGVINGGAALTDVRDVATVMVKAAEKGESGGRYIVAGPLTTMKEIALELEAISGVKAPRMEIPDGMAIAIAWFLEKFTGLTGGVNPMPLAGIQTLLEKAKLSSAKAERDLGATFRPLRETLKDTVLWYQSQGYV
ncbi:3-beta hydroxysteroid dehydrogenase/isomerase [Trichormus variabilis ATCC 29413]|uniref:3-beta hydroxysteroid dehydrogenase/isomerase n=2 Tax=Anabaena variabilis TaxID=264691 RepID=Q3MA24_TRIV2|nr:MULTISPECIES: SDR family oxidoreductase [Nostocaceae]ABA22162.1 3-beta hydroxysteroid dehydrogenase/isomerase [Trichormus variabilis ATCC 29413]MBC1214918.1 SDR family oxidoreductase [Trichormus variabilis ARAD]MBC1256888.1 SDR family oxidoreductase [Trichormus variabilis V5]MBC1269873.1 SDR family oxidoreductase [Trichormus variabilis FSR]MBC1302459.1 SDR family oxidoreductase [Trichormus variabilis N2B]